MSDRQENEIVNPNSSGQGDASHTAHRHPLARIVVDAGYIYSHSTPVTRLDGTRELHHTFKHGEHNVGLSGTTIDRPWETSVSCGSGRQWVGKGENELRAHLYSKGKRYGLKRR